MLAALVLLDIGMKNIMAISRPTVLARLVHREMLHGRSSRSNYCDSATIQCVLLYNCFGRLSLPNYRIFSV